MNIRETLTHIGSLQDAQIDLVDAALTLSCWTTPTLSQAPYHRHVQTLVKEARAYVGPDDQDVGRVLEAVRQIIARRYGYGGEINLGARAEGANLACVIDRRRGGAMALCILYVHVLKALGRQAEILNFSARPLVRLRGTHGHHVLDPFEDGRPLDARQLRRLHKAHAGVNDQLDPFHLQTLSHRQVLIHMLDDIKAHHLRTAAPEAALAALEAELLIAPDVPRLWREAGLLHTRLDHIGDAISDLERFLQVPGNDAHRYMASQVLQHLRSLKDNNRS